MDTEDTNFHHDGGRGPRHTIEVDFVPYLHSLYKLRDRGRKLANAHGHVPPIQGPATEAQLTSQASGSNV